MVADLFGRGGENKHAGERRAASRDNHTHRTNLHYDTPPPQPLYGGWRNTLRSKQAWLEDTLHLTPYTLHSTQAPRSASPPLHGGSPAEYGTHSVRDTPWLWVESGLFVAGRPQVHQGHPFNTFEGRASLITRKRVNTLHPGSKALHVAQDSPLKLYTWHKIAF